MQQIKVGLDGLPKRFSVGASAVEEKQPESPEEKETSFFGAFTSAVKKALNIGEQEAEERKLTFGEAYFSPKTLPLHLGPL